MPLFPYLSAVVSCMHMWHTPPRKTDLKTRGRTVPQPPTCSSGRDILCDWQLFRASRILWTHRRLEAAQSGLPERRAPAPTKEQGVVDALPSVSAEVRG